MEELVKQLAEKGVSVKGLDKDKIYKIAKAVGLDVPRLVEVKDYENSKGEISRMVFTEPYNYVDKNGKERTAGKLVQRAAIAKQIAADFTAAAEIYEQQLIEEEK